MRSFEINCLPVANKSTFYVEIKRKCEASIIVSNFFLKNEIGKELTNLSRNFISTIAMLTCYNHFSNNKLVEKADHLATFQFFLKQTKTLNFFLSFLLPIFFQIRMDFMVFLNWIIKCNIMVTVNFIGWEQTPFNTVISEAWYFIDRIQKGVKLS